MFNLFYYSMKNIKLFSLLFVAAAMIFAGCTKETESVEPGGGEGEGTEEGLVYKEFTVGVSEIGGSKSRTVLGDGGSVLWVEGDEIRVFADVEGANADGYKFTVTEIQDGGKTATISGEVANAEKFYALYPFDAYSEKGGLIKDGGDVYICANIPDNQSISVDGGYDPKACISVAELNSDGGEFKLACGMIGFKFTNETTSQIKEIQVSFKDFSLNGNTDGYLGHLKIKVDGTVEHTGISEMRNIHLLPDGGSQIFKTDKTYYVCMPPILATNNIALTVSFVDSESISLVKKISNVSLDRHQIRETGSLTLTGDDYHLTISNPGDFENWYNEGLNAYPEVTIKGTIDMAGRTLEAKDFSGILNGDNCEIKNLKMEPSSTLNNGLFASLNGATVSDITLVDLNISSGMSYVGAICGSAKGSSTIKGCKIKGAKIEGFNVGGIVGSLSDSFVDGCELTDIELSATVYCGGLVADFSEKSNICASYITGKIINGAIMGGLIGMWNDYYAKIISCYSFMELPSGSNVGYIYGRPYPSTEPIEMHSSWYVSDKLSEYPVGTKTVQGLKDVMDNYIVDEIDKSMNSYLKQANSGYRYVVNPNYSVEDFLTPPLILQKAQ